MSKFFIAPPGDAGWVPSYDGQVIEAEEQPADAWGGIVLKVLAPPSFKEKWPAVNKRYFVECPGPVRTLEFEKYVALIHSIFPLFPLPKRQTLSLATCLSSSAPTL